MSTLQHLHLSLADIVEQRGFAGEGMPPGPRKPRPWGSKTLGDIIKEAILTTPEKMMTIEEIHTWLSERMVYFQSGRISSIKNSLQAGRRFIKVFDYENDLVYFKINPKGKLAVQSEVDDVSPPKHDPEIPGRKRKRRRNSSRDRAVSKSRKPSENHRHVKQRLQHYGDIANEVEITSPLDLNKNVIGDDCMLSVVPKPESDPFGDVAIRLDDIALGEESKDLFLTDEEFRGLLQDFALNHFDAETNLMNDIDDIIASEMNCKNNDSSLKQC